MSDREAPRLTSIALGSPSAELARSLPKEVSPADVAALVETSAEEVVVVKMDVLRTELDRERQSYHSAFDATYAAEISLIGESYARISALLLATISADSVPPEHIRVAMAFLTHAQKSTVAALELLRSGFVMQPNVLTRATLEMAAASFTFITEPSQFNRMRDGNFKSTHGITVFNKVLPMVGRLNGLLSNHFVHIGQLHESPQANIKCTPAHPEVNVTLTHIKATQLLTHIVAELLVIDRLQPPWFWTFDEKSQARFSLTDQAQRCIDEVWTVNGLPVQDTGG